MTCPHKNQKKMGIAIFCMDCKQRVGFVPDDEAKEIIIKGLEQDIRDMGLDSDQWFGTRKP
jgi:hypothetical protein